MSQCKVFDAVRTTVQGLHPGQEFDRDAASYPLLFKSNDEKIWVRVFYQPMPDYDIRELKYEIEKLKKMIAKDSRLYFFYPKLDVNFMLALRAAYHNLAFFEYGGISEIGKGKDGIRVCRWVSASEIPHNASIEIRLPAAIKTNPGVFLSYSRLSQDEVTGLNDISLELARS